MAHQTGSKTRLALGYETTFKTSPAAGYNMPYNTCSLRPSRTLQAAETITGSRNPVQPFEGNTRVEGEIVVPLDSVAMMHWAKAMFGAPTTTGSGPYVHQYKIGDTMPSITLETQFPDLAAARYARYNGCKVSRFSVEFGGDGELTARLGILGAKYTLASAPFDATLDAVSLARVKNFQAALTEGGSAFAFARSVSLDIDFGLDAENYVLGGAGELGSLPEGIVRVSGRVVCLFESDALLAKAANLTESGIRVTVSAGAGSIFEIEVPELYYELSAPEIPGPRGLLAELNFQGFHDNGSEASAVVLRLTNAAATAP